MIQISGLECPKLIPELMPCIASRYDVGPPPILNGRLWSKKYSDAYHHNVSVLYHIHHKKWLINEGFFNLNKSGQWGGDNVFFDTAEEAIEFYFRWKENIIAKAKKMLSINPDAALNYEDF